jgi:hypothetical protein
LEQDYEPGEPQVPFPVIGDEYDLEGPTLSLTLPSFRTQIFNIGVTMTTTQLFFIFVHIFQWIFSSDKYINALNTRASNLDPNHRSENP